MESTELCFYHVQPKKSWIKKKSVNVKPLSGNGYSSVGQYMEATVSEKGVY